MVGISVAGLSTNVEDEGSDIDCAGPDEDRTVAGLVEPP